MVLKIAGTLQKSRSKDKVLNIRQLPAGYVREIAHKLESSPKPE